MKKLTRSQNKLIKEGIILILILSVSGFAAAVMIADSSYVTEVGHFEEQPIAFSHQTHVDGLGLECTFCHSGVEENDSAELPTLETCNGCHQDILKKSNYLDPVRSGYKNNVPVVWERVNKLADHVHFHHGEHIKQGIQCITCHGNVNDMPLMSPQNHFSMQFCLDCHRQHSPRLQECSTCHR